MKNRDFDNIPLLSDDYSAIDWDDPVRLTTLRAVVGEFAAKITRLSGKENGSFRGRH